MWKYLKLGAPPAKQAKTSDSQKAPNKLYDQTKRKRTIVPSWKVEFKEWLVCDDTGQKIYCAPCRSVYGPFATQKHSDKYKKYANSPFVTGSSNLRHDSLVGHEGSTGHKYAVSVKSAKEANAGTSQAEKAVEQLNAKNFDRLTMLFTNVHALAKHSRPMSDFKWMCQADEKKGLDIGPTYRNEMSAKQFLVAISEVVRHRIEKDISEAKFLTVMSDGSTDVSVIEHEIVYIHFAKHGVSTCYFIGLQPCETANSIGIYDAIHSSFRFDTLSQDDIKKKLICFAGDGASVNTGHLNGVIAHFQRDVSSSIVMIRCMGHRVELMFKDAMKGAVLFKKLCELMDQLYKFYHKSPKQMGGLKRAFDSTSVKQVMPTRVEGTCWLAHTQRALTNIIKGYEGFVLHLSQVAIERSQSAVQPKAKFLLGLLKSKSLMIFAHFVLDILAVLVKLSLRLQERLMSVFQVHQDLLTTITSVKKFQTRPGPEQRHLETLLEADDKFKGEKLAGGSAQVAAQIATVVATTIDVLSDRFSDIGGGILEATKIADLTLWPATSDDAVDFGDEHLVVIVDHYRDTLLNSGVDIAVVETEWTMLRQSLYENHKVHSMTWSVINDLYREQYPNLLDVIDLVLSMPASTAECERGFSQMKITKTQYRNKLRSDTMTMLMTVQLHSASVTEFDSTPAIHQWNNHHHRRPNFLQKKHRKSQEAMFERMPMEEEQFERHAEGAASASSPSAAPAASSSSQDSDYDSDFSDLDDSDVDSAMDTD